MWGASLWVAALAAAFLIEEKKIWKDPETTDDWKSNNLKELENRLSGWQLESFKMSYKNKIEKGVSLYKEKQIK